MRNHGSLRGRIALLSGTSGAGKTSLAVRLLQDERFDRAVTATTRKPRGKEVHGAHYYFYSPEEFERRVQRGEFLETAEVYGHRYGTPRASVIDVLRSGRHCILVVDVQGFLTLDDSQALRGFGGDVLTVFVRTRDLETLVARLRSRGEDNETTISRRLADAEQELAHQARFDHVLINEDFDDAARQLVDLILSNSASVPPGQDGDEPTNK